MTCSLDAVDDMFKRFEVQRNFRRMMAERLRAVGGGYLSIVGIIARNWHRSTRPSRFWFCTTYIARVSVIGIESLYPRVLLTGRVLAQAPGNRFSFQQQNRMLIYGGP